MAEKDTNLHSISYDVKRTIEYGSVPGFKTAIESNGSSQPIYVGYAVPGTLQSEKKWLITKITYSGTIVTKTEFANGDSNFDKEWDERTTYTYSS